MCGRERYELLTSNVEERIVVHDEPAGSRLRERREVRSEFRFDACSQRHEPPPERLCRGLHFLYVSFGVRIVGIDEQADRRGAGRHLAEQFQPLGSERTGNQADAGGVAARPAQAGNQAMRTGSWPIMKTMGTILVAA